MFGANKFGDPNYRIAWAQTETQQMGFSTFTDRGVKAGYRDRLKGSSTPCWMILRWKDPAHYGSPDLFYSNTYLDAEDIYFMGQYPWKGRYEILYMMSSTEYVDGTLIVDALPLNHAFIDKVIPLLIEAQYITAFERQAAKKMVEEYKRKEETNEIAERMMDTLPSWYGPVSYAHQGCRTSVLDKMMHKIQKKWDQLSRSGGRPRFSTGMRTGDRPRIATRVS
jgi:hypothetical protein